MGLLSTEVTSLPTMRALVGTWEGRYVHVWSGTLTLQDVGGRRVLKDVAVQKRNGAVFTGEFNLKP